MSGRFLTPKDMAVAWHETEVFNSMLKREEIKDADKITSTRHVICGCGAEGCMFLSHRREETTAVQEARIGD